MLAVSTARRRRRYDHRLRNRIAETRDPRLAADLGVPRSTVATWIRRGTRAVVCDDIDDRSAHQLATEVAKLRRRNAVLIGVVRLQGALLRAFGIRLDAERVADAGGKRTILRAVDAARRVLPLCAVLSVLRLSPSRYHGWRRADEQRRELDDAPSCPRSHPARLTSDEVGTIGEMVTSKDYRHMPLRTLALFAARAGEVVASAATWAKLTRLRGWRRPRARRYPARPKKGVRASRPNELWHIDLTVIKLLDGTRLFLHAVLDNFSRRILAHRLVERVDPATTCAILTEAAKGVVTGGAGRAGGSTSTTVVADSGIENVNGAVDDLLATSPSPLRRVLARVEVAYSNSMIERWWSSLRHGWLYLHDLDTAATVRRLVAFYVEQHNSVMPHSAFRGQTPDEMYFGTGGAVAERLAEAKRRARQRRLERNRAASCPACPKRDQMETRTPEATTAPARARGDSSMSQLRP